MKKLVSHIFPVILGFSATGALFMTAPESFAFLAEDESHIFDNGRSIEVDIPVRISAAPVAGEES